MAPESAPLVMVIDPIGAEELGYFLRPRGVDPYVIFLSEEVDTLLTRARNRAYESSMTIEDQMEHLEEARDRLMRERELFDLVYIRGAFDLMIGRPIGQ